MKLLTNMLLLVPLTLGCADKESTDTADIDADADADSDTDTDADADADTDADSDADADADADDTGSDVGDGIEIAGTWIDIHDDIHEITNSTWSYTGYTDLILEFNNDEKWVITSAIGQYYRTRWIWESDTRWYWCVTAVDTSLDTLEDYGPIDPADLEAGCAGDIWAPMDQVASETTADTATK